MKKRPEIKEVLNNLSKEKLIKIIIDMTQKDTTLKNSLMMRYSKGDNISEVEKCKELIESIVRKYTGKEGFIIYGETYDFVYEMEEILQKARNTEDILLSLDIAILLLNESIEAFQYSDDSMNDIGFLVSETIELIGKIVSDSNTLQIDLKEKIFNKLLKQCDNEGFDEWEEYRIQMLRLSAKYADIESLRNKLKIKINETMRKSPNSGYSKKYSYESMLRILFELIELYGTENESLEFLKENLEYSSFRELLVDHFIKQKDYHKVIELALEGEKQDKNYAGLVSMWKKIRYETYKKLSLKEEQEKLAKELLFDGDFEYYSELKELSSDDKDVFYNSLKQQLKRRKDWSSRNVYLKLIEQEEDLDELMDLVRKKPSSIEGYAKMLIKKYKDEVMHIYIDHIKSVASFSFNRKDYQGVCTIIKRYKKIAGKKGQDQLIHELIVLYRKRPAFVDELSKI